MQSKRQRDPFAIDQCALFKTGSKKRLATLLLCDQAAMQNLADSTHNYKIFEIPAQNDEFSPPRKKRLAQEPKEELRRIHVRILKLLKRIVVPPYLHSAVRGRSYKTNASSHLGSAQLLKVDIKKFFPSTTESRVFSFFADQLQCAPDIARLLAKICTCHGVIPTGSPLSPLLSFYANRPMFDELADLANANQLTFTCYIDDVVFSGSDLRRGFIGDVVSIVDAHGHKIAHGKTRFYSAREPKLVTGVIVKGNQLCVPHSRFKKARAIEKALSTSSEPARTLYLVEKLNGLIGEAATIDPRFRAWGRSINSRLREARGDTH